MSGENSSTAQTLKIFMGGDVFSEHGIAVLQERFPAFKEERGIDFCIINGENASGGYGITEQDAECIFKVGFDVITGGNHIFENRDIYPFLERESRLLRPANYPQIADTQYTVPGRGFGIYEKNGIRYAVLNIQGRESMTAIECPFMCASSYAAQAAENNALLFIDFHAESNEEKESLAFFLDGTVSALCGTHTHVQTADERILPKGTAYITDLGMSGSQYSVIGSEIEIAVKRNITQVSYKMQSACNDRAVCGVLITVDADTKKSISIERVLID